MDRRRSTCCQRPSAIADYASAQAAIADVETCTTREWICIGRALRTLPATADAFAAHQISYAKVRTLTRLATPENEAELLDIARITPANHLGRALAHWLNRTTDPASLETTNSAAGPSPDAPSPTA